MLSAIVAALVFGLPAILLVLRLDGIILPPPHLDLTRIPFRNLPAVNGLIFGVAWIGLACLLAFAASRWTLG